MSASRGRSPSRLKKPPGLEAGRNEAGSSNDKTVASRVPEPLRNAATATHPESSATECFVCCREIYVFAVGVCDHPVCHVCSTRLRVLCDTNECPVCRAVLDEVFFVTEVSSFETLKNSQSSLKIEKYGISFENDDILAKYNELLTNKCNECVRRANIAERSGERSHPPVLYDTFESLREHVQRDHRRHFCDLCVDHLKLFTFERQAYSKCDLRRHLKEGDLNDKSHKGHPRCEHCGTHYLDKDELYRHLKVDHFSCFLCQQENSACRLMTYYATYDDLRQHFSSEHYLCEQGDCAAERFVAFATKLDFKAHTATNHSDTLSKEEQRAARDLAVDFGISPPARDTLRGEASRNAGSRGRGNRDYQRDRMTSGRDRYDEEVRTQQPLPLVDTSSTKDFPSLSGEPTISRPLMPTPKYVSKMTTPFNSAEEFPTLGKPSNPAPSTSHTWFKPTKSNSNSTAAKRVTRVLATCTPSSSAPIATNSSKCANGFSQAKTSAELFPSLPQPVGDSDFGKVLKPLPAKKQHNRQTKLVHENIRPAYVSNSAGVQTNSKSGQQRSAEFSEKSSKGTKSPAAAKTSQFSTVNNLVGDAAHVNSVKTYDSLEAFDLGGASASWAAGQDSSQAEKQPAQFQNGKKVSSAKAGRLPKQEDFPSLGPAKPDVGAPSNFRPLRPKYKGIKPGELGQENRSNDQFIQPPNFAKRSSEFMGMLKLLLNGNAEQVTKYRLLVTNFRKGLISSEEFVYDCTQLFDDSSEFIKVFVELVCLTPDIEKQNELIRLYDNLKTECGSQRKTNVRDWIRCSECGQITIPEDTQAHQRAH